MDSVNVQRVFKPKMTTNRRCEGCGVIVGPQGSYKQGIEVRSGECPGFYHNSQCYDRVKEAARGKTS